MRAVITTGMLVLVIGAVWYYASSPYNLEVVEVSAMPKLDSQVTILTRYRCNRPVWRRIEIDRDPGGMLYAASAKFTTSTHSIGMYDCRLFELLPPEDTKWLWPFATYYIRIYNCSYSGEYSIHENPTAKCEVPFQAALWLGTLGSRPFSVDKRAFTSAALKRGETVYEQGLQRILTSYGVRREYLHFDADHTFALYRHICSIDNSKYKTLFPQIRGGTVYIKSGSEVRLKHAAGVDEQSSTALTLYITFGSPRSTLSELHRPLTVNDVAVTSHSGLTERWGEARAEMILPGGGQSVNAADINLGYRFGSDEKSPSEADIRSFVVAISDNILRALHKP